mmetsp:Transcript_15465/g.42554  ORF Transcript_15465/g.42554 Transcript_15465/m.42554 type:complete len:212 (+) Transcript_15465:775-1410(+)
MLPNLNFGGSCFVSPAALLSRSGSGIRRSTKRSSSRPPLGAATSIAPTSSPELAMNASSSTGVYGLPPTSTHPRARLSFTGSKCDVHAVFKPKRPPTTADGAELEAARQRASNERTMTGLEKRRYPTLVVSSAVTTLPLTPGSSRSATAPEVSSAWPCGKGSTGNDPSSIASPSSWHARASQRPSHVATTPPGNPREKARGTRWSGASPAK